MGGGIPDEIFGKKFLSSVTLLLKRKATDSSSQKEPCYHTSQVLAKRRNFWAVLVGHTKEKVLFCESVIVMSEKSLLPNGKEESVSPLHLYIKRAFEALSLIVCLGRNYSQLRKTILDSSSLSKLYS